MPLNINMDQLFLDFLPIEIWGIILEFASWCDPATYQIIRFICKKWYVLLPPQPASMDIFAKTGNLNLVKWAWANRVPWNNKACIIAARHGDLKMLTWLYKRGAPRGEDIVWAASKKGHLHILQWLYHNTPEPEKISTASIGAAWHGHLHILEWLHEIRQCALDICFYAASGGNIEVLQWARDNEYGWGHDAYYAALINGYHETCSWLIKSGCPNEY